MPVELICKNCEQVFSVPPSRSDAKFCSMECRSEFSSVELSCQNCGNDFSVPEHKSGRKYCSEDCQYQSMQKEYITLSCPNCCKSFDVKPSVSESRTYCSKECVGEATKPGREKNMDSVECEVCGDMFKVWPYRSDDVKTCSWECRNYWMSEKMRKVENPDIRDTMEYRQWRSEVLSKADVCEKCGCDDSLYAHHIIPISEDESKATDVENGQALCTECHGEEHPEIEQFINRNPY